MINSMPVQRMQGAWFVADGTPHGGVAGCGLLGALKPRPTAAPYLDTENRNRGQTAVSGNRGNRGNRGLSPISLFRETVVCPLFPLFPWSPLFPESPISRMLAMSRDSCLSTFFRHSRTCFAVASASSPERIPRVLAPPIRMLRRGAFQRCTNHIQNSNSHGSSS